MLSVDVVVPCYNYAHFLVECVESVLAQSDVSVRVLIIDDASPDDTASVAAAIVRRDARVQLVRHRSNQGHINTYNEGIRWAKAGAMLILSADDYLLPMALGRAAALLAAHPQVGFVYGQAIVSGESGLSGAMTPGDARARESPRILTGRDFINLIVAAGSENIVPTPTAVVRTSLQKHVGGYRADLPHAGDMEMWLRLAAHAFVGVLGTYQAVFRQHDKRMQLAYYRSERQCADLEQRRDCVRVFLDTCAERISAVTDLQGKLLWPIAHQAIRRAEGALADGETELSKRLGEIALRTWPDARYSIAWLRLLVERKLGVSVCWYLRAGLHRLSGLRAGVVRWSAVVRRRMRES